MAGNALAAGGVMVLAAVLTAAPAGARPGADQQRQAPPPRRQFATEASCYSDLGQGVTSRRRYCDVMIARTGAASVSMTMPRYSGTATLMFDLHNRFTVPPAGAPPADVFTRAMALVAVVRPMGELIGRAAVRRELRSAQDLFDRIAGAAPVGVKAVAPGFPEPVRLTLPAGLPSIGIVGVRLEFATLALPHGIADAPGRPIAIVSNLRIEYVPAR